MPDLKDMTKQELSRIMADEEQSDEVIEEAERLFSQAYVDDLVAAVQSFQTATAVFTEMTNDMSGLIAKIKRNPVGDTLKRVTEIVDAAGDAYRVVAGLADEPANLASEDPAEAITPVPPEPAPPLPPQLPPPPAPGTVAVTSASLAENADEYRAMFAAATVRLERTTAVDRFEQMLLGGKPRYEAVEEALGMPWWFVGVIHGLESSFNFARHLHNGDKLTERTTRVPAGFPQSGAPPFTWEESARDAMLLKGLENLQDWSLPAVLNRWERYNGMGYRKRGLASPYLWSFSNQYVKGKYVADGQFDPDFVSQQVGAATALRSLAERGRVDV